MVAKTIAWAFLMLISHFVILWVVWFVNPSLWGVWSWDGFGRAAYLFIMALLSIGWAASLSDDD